MNFTVFFTFQGSSSSAKKKLTEDHDCAIMMTRAEYCLDNLINSVEKGNVTVSTLKFLEEHCNQYLKLGEIHKTTLKVSNSIKDSFSQRLCELKAFFTLKDHLECFIHFSEKFTSGIPVINLFSE
jgi:formyltetrahydrofolate hydrolase